MLHTVFENQSACTVIWVYEGNPFNQSSTFLDISSYTNRTALFFYEYSEGIQ